MESIKNLLCDERIMMMAIVLNTIIMYVGGFWPDSQWFAISDAVFTLLFLFMIGYYIYFIV